MANLAVKVGGWIRGTKLVYFEETQVNGSLHTFFSGMIDGFPIDKLIITSIGTGLYFKKSGVVLNVGQEITMTDINNGLITVMYDHQYPSVFVEFKAIGNVKYQVTLQFLRTQ